MTTADRWICLSADEVFALRFAEESRIAAPIEHPNVVPIYAAGEAGGVPFIAMRCHELAERIGFEVCSAQ